MFFSPADRRHAFDGFLFVSRFWPCRTRFGLRLRTDLLLGRTLLLLGLFDRLNFDRLRDFFLLGRGPGLPAARRTGCLSSGWSRLPSALNFFRIVLEIRIVLIRLGCFSRLVRVSFGQMFRMGFVADEDFAAEAAVTNALGGKHVFEAAGRFGGSSGRLVRLGSRRRGLGGCWTSAWRSNRLAACRSWT